MLAVDVSLVEDEVADDDEVEDDDVRVDGKGRVIFRTTENKEHT